MNRLVFSLALLLVPGIALPASAIAGSLDAAVEVSPSASPNPSPSPTPTPPTNNGSVFEWADAQNQFDHVMAFRLWIPQGLARARGVVVLAPGYAGDGRPLADEAAFQALAEHTGTVLLACCMKGEQNGSYDDPAHWSGNIFLRALRELAVSSSHPELAEAPLAFWGHSAGGMFNYNFACWKPDRVIAFIANKGGYYTTMVNDPLFHVPGLWIAGANDKDERVLNITNLFAMGRRRDAPWCLAVEPNTRHEVGRSKELGIAYLETMIPLRLGQPLAHDGAPKSATSPSVAPADAQKILPITTQGWVGDLTHHEIRPYNPKTDAGRITSWFPDENFAKFWRSIVTGQPAAATGH